MAKINTTHEKALEHNDYFRGELMENS